MEEFDEKLPLSQYQRRISAVMNMLDVEMFRLPDDSEVRKDMQYLHALLDIVYGSADLCGSGYEARAKDFEETKQIISKMELMK
ncbi:MAG: hypothetical protein OEY89_13985 [Gammaproteobacteria bacterium]|nr:hypothetical protein [Gammaproteobacteria bacterium]